jgi:hypothetical protein
MEKKKKKKEKKRRRRMKLHLTRINFHHIFIYFINLQIFGLIYSSFNFFSISSVRNKKKNQNQNQTSNPPLNSVVSPKEVINN